MMTMAAIMAILNAMNPSDVGVGGLLLFVIQVLFGKKLPNLSGFLRTLMERLNEAGKPVEPKKPELPGPGETDRIGELLLDAIRNRIRRRLVGSGDGLAEAVKIVTMLEKEDVK